MSGILISIPIEEKLPYENPFYLEHRQMVDELTFPIPNNMADCWKKVDRAKIQELATVEIPLNETHAPWPSLPGFELKVIASGDYENFDIAMKPADDAVDRQERTIEFIPVGLNLSFKMKSAEPTEKSRVFFKVELVR